MVLKLLYKKRGSLEYKKTFVCMAKPLAPISVQQNNNDQQDAALTH